MNFNFVTEEVGGAKFPQEAIKKIVENIDATVVEVVDKEQPSGFRELEDRYSKLKFLGVNTEKSSHTLDGKIKHDCHKTSWETYTHGHLTEYSYKFCELCRNFFDRRAVVFNKEDNACRIIKFKD